MTIVLEIVAIALGVDMRFAVYKHKLVYKDTELIQRSMIVLKEDDEVLAWTNFHKYVRGGGSRSVSSDNAPAANNIVKLLNYVFFDQYHIDKLTDIKKEMVRDFLNDYGLCRLQGDIQTAHRAKSTVERCIINVMDFLEEMLRQNTSCKMKISDLYTQEKKYSKQKKRYITIRKPIFEVLYGNEVRPMLRDLPEKVFQIIFNRIMTIYPNLLMLAALGAFAGLRPSEACNVRRTDSPLGAGIRFEMADGNIKNIFIDLKKELVLRSDLVSVGKIKKEREQRVYPAFLEVFYACYQRYMSYIQGRKYEAKYGALTLTRDGKAFTYDSYRKAFHDVVEACIPEMLASDDFEVVTYGQLLMEKQISPHIFRHWFSVKLTLYGEGVEGLMYWRGDKSPESALTYINNKSDLERQYEKVSSEIFNYSLWKSEKQQMALKEGMHD